MSSSGIFEPKWEDYQISEEELAGMIECRIDRNYKKAKAAWNKKMKILGQNQDQKNRDEKEALLKKTMKEAKKINAKLAKLKKEAEEEDDANIIKLQDDNIIDVVWDKDDPNWELDELDVKI